MSRDPHWLARLLRAAIGVDTEPTSAVTAQTAEIRDQNISGLRARHDSGEFVVGPWVRTTGDDDDAA
jgi:hypothetical protein